MAERLTIIDFVEKYVAKFSDRPFLWEKNLDTNQWDSTTYAETLCKAKRIAAGLMALGVEKGDKISYLSEGRDMWVIGELGVLFAGAVNVPLSIKLEETNDLVFRVKHSDSKHIGVLISKLLFLSSAKYLSARVSELFFVKFNKFRE